MLGAETDRKICNRCGQAKSIFDFHIGREYRDGRKSTCKDCHAAKYCQASGYISPRNAAAKLVTASRMKRCSHCDQDMLRSNWSRDASGHLKPRCAACMAKYRAKKPRKQATPQKKAEYARAKYGVTCEYIPQAKRNEIAEELRREREALKIRESQERREQRASERAAFKAAQHDSHVGVFKSPAVRWRIRYSEDNVFAVRQRLRTQLRKKLRLYPKLDGLMRDALKRKGGSPMVEEICGYSIQDLATHLESQFVDGMSWERFRRGEIHIDHRRPQSSFDLNDPDQVRLCWALSNLQPLWARDNLTKGARWARTGA